MLSGLYQICYVTRDLDAGMRQLTAIHGVERFRVKRDVPAMPGMPKMMMNQAHVFIGPLQIELIQPAGGDDALYRDVCAEAADAIRFHHFGLWVDEPAEFGALPARWRRCASRSCSRSRCRKTPVARSMRILERGWAGQSRQN
jgi:hypothetical protein